MSLDYIHDEKRFANYKKGEETLRCRNVRKIISPQEILKDDIIFRIPTFCIVTAHLRPLANRYVSSIWGRTKPCLRR